MPVAISTQIIHASFAAVINKIQKDANIYDNPNQQGTVYPAWFIVHRSPVEVQKEMGKRCNGNRYLITYQIDLWYMLQQNITRLFDQYTEIAELLEYNLQYLPIFGSDAVVQIYDRSWSLELNALKYSTTLKLRVYTDEKFVLTPMQVIEDLSVFLKNHNESTITFTNTEHPEFDPSFPTSMNVTTGKSVNLPYVGGEFEDEEYYWYPDGWSLGQFGALVQVNGNVTTNLLWRSEERAEQYTVTYTNTSKPEFDIELPESEVVYSGTVILLPAMSGRYTGSGLFWRPLRWSAGNFGAEITIESDTTIDLVWTSFAVDLYTIYTDYGVYRQSSMGNSQTNATNATAQIQKTNSLDTVHRAYTSSTNPEENVFTPDVSSVFEIGYYNSGGTWVRQESIDDLPTTVALSSMQVCTLLRSGMLWYAQNGSNSSLLNVTELFYVQERVDTREWTTTALYRQNSAQNHQPACTCYTSPAPSDSAYTAQLFTDSGLAQPFYYDLDRDYRLMEQDGSTPSRWQSIWDLDRESGGASKYFTFLLKTGKMWYVTNGSQVTSQFALPIYIQSVAKEYDEDTITLDLGLRSSMNTVTFSSNDYWFSYLRNTLDKQKAVAFGMQLDSNQNQLSKDITGFNIEIIALCDIYENTVITDMSNFRVDNTTGDALRIRSTNAYSTPTAFWRVRITKGEIPPTPSNRTLELLLYCSGGNAVSFNANDYWFSDIRNAEDMQSAINFGASISNNRIVYEPSSFEYYINGVYSDQAGTNRVSSTLDNFTPGTRSNNLVIQNVSAVSGATSWKCLIARPGNVLEVVLWFKQNGTSATFNANDYWYSMIRNDADKTRLTAFGVSINANQISYSSAFTFLIVGIYSNSSGTSAVDGTTTPLSLDNFYLDQGTQMHIHNNAAVSTSVSSWKLRIIKN